VSRVNVRAQDLADELRGIACTLDAGLPFDVGDVELSVEVNIQVPTRSGVTQAERIAAVKAIAGAIGDNVQVLNGDHCLDMSGNPGVCVYTAVAPACDGCKCGAS
jgi:hypothetical protein